MNYARLSLCSGLSLLTLSILCACGGLGAPQPGADAPEAAPPPAAADPAATPASAPATATTAKAVNAGECTKVPLLDDTEDGNNQISATDKRGGYWYTYADNVGTTINPTGNFTMSEGGAEGSKHAARMNGKIGTGEILYAGMGFSLTEPKALYDASCCKGVSFWAKKAGAGTAAVRFKIGDVNTTPEGGVCKNCYNDFGVDLTLTDDWKKYEVPFADMKQEGGWGDQFPAIDASRLFQAQWQVKEAGKDFDVWVDKIELFGCGG